MDANEKRMAGLSQELPYLKKEVHSCDDKSEEQQEIIRAFIVENKKLADERIKIDLEQKEEVEKWQKEINTLKEVNRKLQDEKFQIAYTYRLNIVQSLNMRDK